ncbi:hypothetical protein [Nocardiopsis sp. NRRL B-16309]|uniref:hypothetical protein n=1 Tax=Nocardiopsis sp. NRRL B-16309 TaxID=1519494 RepID=UPI0006ADBC9E|nr:hypothetical protein [Nocardiopsis sp. NRRL B-16309]KOX10175.1 hypothetical protein ADL05_26240 [Nocardiopsis sp. NRRL B-16309]
MTHIDHTPITYGGYEIGAITRTEAGTWTAWLRSIDGARHFPVHDGNSDKFPHESDAKAAVISAHRRAQAHSNR